MKKNRFHQGSDSPSKKSFQEKKENPPSLLLYGVHPVLAALHSSKLPKEVWVQEGMSSENTKSIVALAHKKNILVKEVSKKELDSFSSESLHQGVLAFLQESRFYEELEVLQNKSLVVVLDHLEDPQNFGAILRSCVQLGVDGVVIPKHRSVGITGGVLKASSGAAFHIPLIQHSSLLFVLEKLKDWGYWIYSTEKEEGTSLPLVDFAKKIVLVMGNEAKGVSDALKKKSDFQISIPTKSSRFVDSLNVSVATAICLYEISRFRTLHK